MPLAFAPFDAYWVAPLCMGLAALLWRGIPLSRALWRGWLFGLGMFGGGVHWVYFSLHDYGQASPVVAGLLTLLLVGYLAVYPALVAAGMASAQALTAAPSLLLLFPALWTLSEWLREWVLTGFPWLALGYSQSDSVLAGWAPVLGVHGLSLFAAVLAGALALMVNGTMVARSVALGLAALLLFSGHLLQRQEWTRALPQELSVTLVQGNIEQDLKWRPEWRRKTLDRYVGLTFDAESTDLVIWPETALPFYMDQLGAFGPELSARLRRRGSLLLTGAPTQVDGQTYNSLVALGSAAGAYNKQHLVPFGEFIPMRGLLHVFGDYVQIPMSDFGRGDAQQPGFELGSVRIGASICYEIIFPGLIRRSLPESNVLVNVSNDAWFGNSLAPHQHLQIARLRAMESERYVLRGTNNGISAIIDATGTVLARTPQFEERTLIGQWIPRTGATPYARWGATPSLLLALGMLLAALLSRRRKPSGRV